MTHEETRKRGQADRSSALECDWRAV
jgi:hypothetical protein